MKELTILIPTYNRPDALAVTLTSLCFQEYKNFSIVISDQTPAYNATDNDVVQAAMRVLYLHGIQITIQKHLPNKGLAEHRQFLLAQSKTKYSLFLDDDLILENYVLTNMINIIREQQCGFVGCAVIGLSYLNDFRPQEQKIEFWHEKVKPEIVKPNTKKWRRYQLHNAANIQHVADVYKVNLSNPQIYKVAWVGGCVLYDTEKIKKVGGFSFWKDLPIEHCGEDVMVQLRVMEIYGGCGILPSGVYHQELPTTIKKRDINAPEFFQL